MITEEEAKQRWCPFARTVEKMEHGISHPRNRVVNVSGANSEDVELIDMLVGTACIASQCMAWEWEIELQSPTITGAVVGEDGGHGIRIGSGLDKVPVKTNKGDCGLKR